MHINVFIHETFYLAGALTHESVRPFSKYSLTRQTVGSIQMDSLMKRVTDPSEESLLCILTKGKMGQSVLGSQIKMLAAMLFLSRACEPEHA